MKHKFLRKFCVTGVAVGFMLSGNGGFASESSATEGAACLTGQTDPCLKMYPLNYTNKIAPLVNKYCVSCHQAGGQAGKWPFTTKEQVAGNIQEIIKDLESDRMPHGATIIPDPKCGGADRFAGSHLLTPEEKQAFKDWEAKGSPDCSDKEKSTTLAQANGKVDNSKWELGQPDLIIPQVSGGFVVQPGTSTDQSKDRDFFRNFNLPDDFFKHGDRLLTAFEIKPGNLAPASDKEPFPIVHHVHIFVVPNGADADKAESKYKEDLANGTLKEKHLDGKDGWEARTFEFPTEIVGSWFPGQNAFQFPPGIAQKIPQGAKLVMQIHYTNYNERPLKDNTSVGLYFARSPVTKERKQLEAVNEHFLIKANDPDHTEKTHVTVPCDASLHSLLPHQHQLGSMNEINAIEPDGHQWCVEKVKWDFDHQYAHDLAKPLHLKKGTVLEETCHWDNRNRKYFPRQINDPPKDIDWGPIASKEMCRADYAITCDDEKLTPGSASMSSAKIENGLMKVSGTGINPNANILVNGKLYTDTKNDHGILTSASAARENPNMKPSDVAIVNSDGSVSEADSKKLAWRASPTGDFKTADVLELEHIQSGINQAYVKDVKPLITRDCLACHNSKASVPFYNLATFGKVKGDIDSATSTLDFNGDYPFKAAGMPDQIQLLRELKGATDAGTMPPTSYLYAHWKNRFSKEEAAKVTNWANNSIKQLEPLSPSRDLSYLTGTPLKAQKAIRQCTACHNDSNASGGFNADRFGQIAKTKYYSPSDPKSSKLYQDILSGRMPKGDALTPEEKGVMLKWLEEGATEK